MPDSQQRAAYYRKLFAQLDPAKARDLIDRLQILALTRPDTVRELETFFERDEARKIDPAQRSSHQLDVSK